MIERLHPAEPMMPPALLALGMPPDLRGVEAMNALAWSMMGLSAALSDAAIAASPTFRGLLDIAPAGLWGALFLGLALLQVWSVLVAGRPELPGAAFCRRYRCRRIAMQINLYLWGAAAVQAVAFAHTNTLTLGLVAAMALGSYWCLRELMRRVP